MTELMTNDTGSFYYVNNVLYPKNFTEPLVNNTKVIDNLNLKFTNKTSSEIKKSVNKISKITNPKTKLIVSNNKDPRKIHKKGEHEHDHDHEHEHHEHHKYIHHEHGGKGCGHKHMKFHGHKHKGGGKHKKVLYPMMIGLLTAKAIILPLVLKMLAFWSAKGLLLGLIATVMASILSLKKMIEPHYKIEGKKDEGTKIELVSLPLHDRVHHHPKIYEYSAEGDESQNHPYGAYYHK